MGQAWLRHDRQHRRPSAKGFDTLSFRMAVVALDRRRSKSPSWIQDRKVAVKGSEDFSDALYGIARKRNGTILLVDAPEDAIYAGYRHHPPLC